MKAGVIKHMNTNRERLENEESPVVISTALPVYTSHKMPLLLKKKKKRPNPFLNECVRMSERLMHRREVCLNVQRV